VAGIPQLARLARCALALAFDAAVVRCAAPFRDPAARESARERLHERSARRLVATLGALKGAFAKAGQFAAMRHDLLPKHALESFAALRSRVEPLPFERIVGVVERELGAPLESAFAEFEAHPIGAASIAQVHRARLPTGEPVVVKVQYPWLRASLPTDLALLRALLRPWLRRLPEADWERAFAEFSAGLADELDFRAEARVAEEIAGNLARDPRIVVPAPVHTHTTQRVLTMAYYPVIPIDDRDGLLAAGVDPARVLEIIARAYAKQIFADGLFHADPHPGNLFVIAPPTGAADRGASAAEDPRVLFIDFGLSRRLDPELRRELRLGLFALMQRDVDAFVAGMERMGMIRDGAREGVRRSVQAMFERIAAAGAEMGGSGALILGLKDEAKALLQRTDGIQLPMDLLFYAKTVSYLFALGEALAPEVDVMKSALPYLLEFLARDPDARRPVSSPKSSEAGAPATE
jgi:ubiquinone biosynthesis protein